MVVDQETGLTERNKRDHEQHVEFSTKYANFLGSPETNFVDQQHGEVDDDLCFWAVYRSWTYCKECGSVDRLKLMPSFQSKLPVKLKSNCHCKNARYIVPCLQNIPDGGLSYCDILTLRPLDIHVGDYKCLKHGYQQKTNMCRVSWSEFSTEEKISEITEDAVRTKLTGVYKFLMSYKESSYSNFVKNREHSILTDKS